MDSRVPTIAFGFACWMKMTSIKKYFFYRDVGVGEEL